MKGQRGMEGHDTEFRKGKHMAPIEAQIGKSSLDIFSPCLAIAGLKDGWAFIGVL